ncbi:MAG: 2-amino-4-hydroxy-6-hydroxymethyldihydropteridine diphosphokinase [Flavobacteriaceae bacterium]|tara:strand:- start:2172 stop:2681 length:510 start_codon:yes stop_codon:yes gene_type:complete
MKHVCYLSLGSNIGDRLNFIRKALDLLKDEKLVIDKISSVYECKSWGFVGSDFFNICVKIKTFYNPHQLLKKIQKVEKRLGRVEDKKESFYSSRTIDLDILFFDNLILNKKELIIPHPRVELRNFVLVPLSEISKNLVHPISGITIEEIIELKKDNSLVKKRKLCIYDL